MNLSILYKVSGIEILCGYEVGIERGRKVSRYSFKHFLSQSTEKLRRGTFLFFKKILVSRNFMDKRWGMKQGGMSRYSFKQFLSQSTEKLRRGTFLFFEKNSGIEKLHG